MARGDKMRWTRVFAPLRRRQFRRMVVAQFFSEVGDGIVTVALPLYVYSRTQSALATSLTFSAELLAGAVMGVIGGVLADGFDRQRILVVSYAGRCALLIAAFFAGPLWLIVAFGALARAGGQLDNPAFDAMVPEHADNDLQQVLAVRRFVQGVSLTIGPAIGALTVELIGARSALLTPCAAFVSALAVLATVSGLDLSLPVRRQQNVHDTIGQRIRSMEEGLAILAKTPVVRRLMAYSAASMVVIAIAMASAIVWFEERLDVAGSWYGLSIAAYGVGSTVGLAWAGGRTFRRPLAVLLVVAAPVYAASNLLGVLTLEPWLLPVSWLLWGVATGPEYVVGEVLVVRSVPEGLRGRAFAAIAVIMLLSAAIGYGIAGVMLELLGPRATTASMSFALLALGLMWIGPAARSRQPRRALSPAIG
jgi:MFS family permease